MQYPPALLRRRLEEYLEPGELVWGIRPIRRDNRTTGCQGRITYVPSGQTLFVCTHPLIGGPSKCLIRYAAAGNPRTSCLVPSRDLPAALARLLQGMPPE